MNDPILEYFGALPEARDLLVDGKARGKADGEAEEDPSTFDWRLHARSNQWWPAGRWRIWMILAGRGFGKTRAGAETTRMIAASGKIARVALVGETAADVRDVMVEGPDGILACSPTAERPDYHSSKRRLTWPNGVVGSLYAGADPEQLRGPQHGFAWVDELAKFAYADQAWDNLMMGLRMSLDPRCLVTTTPRPIPLIRSLIQRAGTDVALTRGSTYDNAANLPEPFIRDILSRYEGTTIGRQELLGELLDEAPGALWHRADLEAIRCEAVPVLVRIVVGVDPSVSARGQGDACGIVAAGIDESDPPRAYVLADASINASPMAWARAVCSLYHRYAANYVVAEGNQGGALVREVLHSVDLTMPVQIVYASNGKAARAEPVAALYEQRRVFHAGSFPALEDELVTWVPGRRSPNRLDALVWALTSLLVHSGGAVSGELF